MARTEIIHLSHQHAAGDGGIGRINVDEKLNELFKDEAYKIEFMSSSSATIGNALVTTATLLVRVREQDTGSRVAYDD